MNNAEDTDYEPDVLKFKQIWREMKDTNDENKTKNQQTLTNAAQPKSKKKTGTKNNEQAKHTQKHTVISQKNVVRNPKREDDQVVEVITRPADFQQESLKNRRQFVNRQDYVQDANNSTYQNEVISLKKMVSQKDYEVSLLRTSNTRNEDRIRVLQNQILKRDERITQLEGRQRQILLRNNALTGNEKIFDFGQVEYENFKNDTRRLLKMLQTTSEYQQFANLGLDDNGIRFLNSANKKHKSFLDTKEKTKLHFCTCNKDFIPESGFWVPEKVYSYAKQFLKERKGEMTNAQLQLLLYDLNKIWREREKRIVNTLKSDKAHAVASLKRRNCSAKRSVNNE